MAPKTNLSAYAFYCAPGELRKALRSGEDPNQRDPETQRTPLMWLCEMFDHNHRSRKRMFRLLVRAGADIELQDHTGMTALEVAQWGAIRVFRRFVEREYWRRRAVAARRTGGALAYASSQPLQGGIAGQSAGFHRGGGNGRR